MADINVSSPSAQETTDVRSAFQGILKNWRVIAASGVAVPHTGTLVETTLATITIPAGAMGANGLLRISSLWSYTNSANNKIPRCRFGGTNLFQNTLTTTASAPLTGLIFNRNSQSSQLAGISTGLPAATANNLNNAIVNTASAADITFTATLANIAETMTLESYLVELFYQA